MKNHPLRTALGASALLLCSTSASAQEGAEAADSSPPVAATAAATIDGFVITDEDIERRFMVIIMEQTRGRMLPPEQLADLRQSFRPQILEELIDDHLLDIDVARAEISMTKDELVSILARSFDGQLLRSNYTRESFAEQLQAAENITIEELLARQADDAALRQALLHVRLIETRYPDEVALSDEAVKSRYERDLDKFYSKPEMVRASHILLGQQGMTEEQAEAARAQAEAVLIECRQEGADFAELARTHSTGPSGPTGGDLDFFSREAMVAPFADAAFAMQVGDISELVKSEFGFHIILVTDRRESYVVPLDQVALSIQDELRIEKVGPLRETHLTKLRQSAKIEYPGQEAEAPLAEGE